MNFSDTTGWLKAGYLLLVFCCVFYLIWWCAAFNPLRSFPMPVKVALFCPTLLCGAGGLALTIRGIAVLPDVVASPSKILIVLAGIAVYLILLLLTGRLLHRQVTTELLLITGWTVLELCAAAGLYGAGIFSGTKAVISVAVTLSAAVIGMACYLAYYNLKEIPAFCDGMIPLVLFAVAMVIQLILI